MMSEKLLYQRPRSTLSETSNEEQHSSLLVLAIMNLKNHIDAHLLAQSCQFSGQAPDDIGHAAFPGKGNRLRSNYQNLEAHVVCHATLPQQAEGLYAEFVIIPYEKNGCARQP